MADVKKLPIIFREKGSTTRKIVEEEAKKQGVRLKPVIEVEGREAMRELVASGAGIGFISEAEFVTDNRVVLVCPIEIGKHLSLKLCSISSAVTHCSDLFKTLLERMPSNLASIRYTVRLIPLIA